MFFFETHEQEEDEERHKFPEPCACHLDGRLDGGVLLLILCGTTSFLVTACLASSGSRLGSERMFVVALKHFRERKTAGLSTGREQFCSTQTRTVLHISSNPALETVWLYDSSKGSSKKLNCGDKLGHRKRHHPGEEQLFTGSGNTRCIFYNTTK